MSFLKTNKYDEATAPTGSVASFINGKTHDMILKISPPESYKFYEVTTNVIISNDRWIDIFIFIDEGSMAVRPF